MNANPLVKGGWGICNNTFFTAETLRDAERKFTHVNPFDPCHPCANAIPQTT